MDVETHIFAFKDDVVADPLVVVFVVGELRGKLLVRDGGVE